ncbi:hypothetical protein FRX31_014718 [Thalictrum thalictroides]|uniref:BED-type domain-containing protein n=1 Tax=Thalictrum thalictroides TaxID=46969 RepID=A0A7J6WGZ3_THATH|nr:hypothetical protein FRX31_014718 [Thalictrum thalictroides]
MSSPNPNDSIDIGASSTAPIAIDESTADKGTEQVDEARVSSQEHQITDSKRQKRKSLAVWENVSEVMENGKRVVKCNHCQKLSICKGGPTTTYKRHIDTCTSRKAKISGQGNGGI